MSGLVTAFGLLTALIVLDVTAMLWGTDSRDGPDSPEWERRRNWRGYRR